MLLVLLVDLGRPLPGGLSRTMSIKFLDESVKAGSVWTILSVGIPLSDAYDFSNCNVFIRDFRDFPVVTASYFITYSNIEIHICSRINKNQTTHLFSANFNKNEVIKVVGQMNL